MSSRGWTNISAESISGEARRVIRSKVSGAALLRVLLHRGLGRVFFTFFTFFPFLFDFFFGRWVGREAFRYFPQHFLPDAIVVNDFLFEVQAPRQAFSLQIDQIDDQQRNGKPQSCPSAETFPRQGLCPEH